MIGIALPRSRNALLSLVKRRGAVIPLVAVFVIILVAMAAFSIDVAYMELVRTQLRAATDAAAKAGTSALVQGKSDWQAQTAAINMAALNKVAGKPLKINFVDVVTGQSVQQNDGTWNFVAGAKPSQAVQVTSRLTNSSTNGSVALFFGPMLGTNSYSAINTSIASAYACDVCLVLDRSHSMCFDQSGTPWSYPPPIYSDWAQGIESPPTNGSRWMALDSAINSFCNILTAANAPPRIAVVTWASTVASNSSESYMTGQTSEGVSTDVDLSSDISAVYSAVHDRSQNVMLGATDMASGINRGTAILTGGNARKYAKKIMILMTDGQWNTGGNPIDAADAAQAQNITIHSVCFLHNADQTTTQAIATMTGGQFYYATDAASLTAAFNKLAYTLPVVLTR